MQQPNRPVPPAHPDLAHPGLGAVRSLVVGCGVITMTSEAFLNGYQEGHLTYMVQDRTRQHSDESITALVLGQLESLDHSSLYGTGFIVGWLATLVTRGMQRRERDDQHRGSREETR